MVKPSIRFIVFLGIVSLFADYTYEGARAIVGPYLSILGASGAAVGVIVGLGEFLGYALRGVSGFLSDKTKRYWLLTFIGYIVNLASVPLLAGATHWQAAAVLIILERVGKSIRVPARDAMLSFATKEIGRGWGFGLHEAMDQIGAVLGPLTIAIFLYYKKSYQFSFLCLAIPAALAILTLSFANRSFPHPESLEINRYAIKTKGFDRQFWHYLFAIGLAGLGFTSFPLIAFHLQKTGSISTLWIPLLYAIANGIAGLSSLGLGKAFDRVGISFLALVTGTAAFFAPLVFLGSFPLVVIGMILWGIGLGSQDSIMRAFVAHLVAPHQRGSAYGLLNLVFGLSWALGNALMGYFYDVSLAALIAFSLTAQILSVPVFLRLTNPPSKPV
jgi:MFS family permease